MPKFTPRAVGLIASLLVLLAIGFMQARSLWVQSPSYDDSYNASMARNLAIGEGFRTSYGGKIYYNPYVTTGLTELLPLALVYRLVGQTYWAPGLVSCAFILVFLGLVLHRMATRGMPLLLPFAVAVLALFAISSQQYGSALPRQWTLFFGEIPAILMLLYAGLLLFDERTGRRDIVIGGLVLAGAVLSKYLALLGVLGVLALFVWDRVFVKQGPRRARLADIGLLLAVYVAPQALYWIIRRMAFTRAEYAEFQRGEAAYIAEYGSGLAQLKRAPDKLDHIVQNVIRSGKVVNGMLAGPLLATLCYLALAATLAYLVFYRRYLAQPRAQLFAAIALGAAIHLAWYLLLGVYGWPRHYIQGGGYLFFALGLATLLPIPLVLRIANGAVLAAVLVLVSGDLRTLRPSLNWAPEPRLAALLEARDFLVTQSGKTLLACGWWANRDLELLLPGSDHFQDCLSYQPKPEESLLLVRSEYWNWDHVPEQTAMEAKCADILFQRPPFVVSRCPNPYR